MIRANVHGSYVILFAQGGLNLLRQDTVFELTLRCYKARCKGNVCPNRYVLYVGCFLFPKSHHVCGVRKCRVCCLRVSIATLGEASCHLVVNPPLVYHPSLTTHPPPDCRHPPASGQSVLERLRRRPPTPLTLAWMTTTLPTSKP